VETQFAESEIEQMFRCFGCDPLAPRFWLHQVPDFTFFGASQDDYAAESNEITSWAVANRPDDGPPRIRRGFQQRVAKEFLALLS
jgi:hypothetical protein